MDNRQIINSNPTFEPGMIRDFKFVDLDHMTELCPYGWSQTYRKTTNTDEHGYYRQIHTADIQLSQIGWITGLHIQTDCPPGTVGIASQTKGLELTRFCGRGLQTVDSMLMTPGNEYDLVASRGTEYTVMAVNIDRFKQHALAVWGEIPRLLPMTGLLKARSPAHQELLQEKIRNTLHLFSDHPEHLSDPNSAMVIEDELLDVLLWATKPPPLHLRHAIRHKHAKKAELYIRDHIDKPISIRSLCESIGVSERALRNGFVEYFGLSPKRYMQNLRLHQIRRALKAANPKETTVTRIVMDWGVSHLGRFSRDYRRVFGEIPSAALKRSQR